MGPVHGIVPAAGSGTRFGGKAEKHLLQVAGRPVVDHSVAALLSDGRVAMVHVAVAPEADASVPGSTLDAAQAERVRVHRCGGATRALTVLAAARIALGEGAGWVAVQDAVRPCLHPDDLRRLLDAAEEKGRPALLAARVPDTLKRGEGGRVAGTVPREGMFLAQTPQVAECGMLIGALEKHGDVTDEAEALEREGISPLLVEAERPNPKLTYPGDVGIVAALLAGGK